MKKLRPLHDRMLVRRVEEKDTAGGGIIIPDTAKEKPMEGKVLAVGNGRLLDNGTKLALDVKVGTGSCSASIPGPRVGSTARKC